MPTRGLNAPLRVASCKASVSWVACFAVVERVSTEHQMPADAVPHAIYPDCCSAPAVAVVATVVVVVVLVVAVAAAAVVAAAALAAVVAVAAMAALAVVAAVLAVAVVEVAVEAAVVPAAVATVVAAVVAVAVLAVVAAAALPAADSSVDSAAESLAHAAGNGNSGTESYIAALPNLDSGYPSSHAGRLATVLVAVQRSDSSGPIRYDAWPSQIPSGHPSEAVGLHANRGNTLAAGGSSV